MNILVRKILLAGIIVLLVFGAGFVFFKKQKKESPELEPKQLIGGDRDEHGCIGSAGYGWCEAKQKCLRIWEEGCGSVENPANVGKLPENKKDCQAKGGRWARIGLSLNEICNLPTSDAGKTCSYKSDCEGSCIAQLLKEDEEKVRVKKETVLTKGSCTPWMFNVGCHPFVEGGKVEGILCVD